MERERKIEREDRGGKWWEREAIFGDQVNGFKAGWGGILLCVYRNGIWTIRMRGRERKSLVEL